MAEFLFTKDAAITPTHCIGCSTHSSEQGFVDLVVELPGYGRVYLCAGCVQNAGRHVGMVQEGVHEQLRDDFAELLLNVDRLEGELDDAKPIVDAAVKVAAKRRAA